MGFIYTYSFKDVAVTAAQDFFEVLPATQRPVLIHAVYLSQYTDFADAAEEIIRIAMGRGHTTSGSGGSSPTAFKTNINAPTPGVTVEANNATIASAGTHIDGHVEDFNIRVPYVWMPAPEDRIRVENPALFVVRLTAAPTDSLTMSGTIVLEEI